MPIFQKSVIVQFLLNNGFVREKADKIYPKFKELFSEERIAEIKKLKEEEYQDGFLRDLFVDIFGYTLRPDANYNLVRERKNESNSKKADGAIIKDDNVLAVIELKSNKTKDIAAITSQAFGYKNNNKNCRYVITSNFQYLRLFIDDATEYQEFDLYRISQEEFRLLYLLLNKNSFFDDMPAKLKEATAYHEKNVTEKLYKNYKAFKDELFKDVCHYNKKFDKLTLFKKTQKLLDRLLFIFFAEDAGLIPANANVKMFDDFKALNEIYDCKVTLYSRYQKLFGALDKGHIYKNWGKIPAYNGGLFRLDEILDSADFLVSDNILLRHCATMAEYDFNSEVDVNILGHIFEHSMGEVEEIAAELEGTAIEKDKTRRKKDGVFYTPRYITRYIVNATLGVLCAQKCTELGIDNIILEEAKETADKATLLLELQKYKTWLLGLKILDPACGSGAFLNQTLDFLVAEHRRVNALIANISGAEAEAETNNDDKQILENNIFGVDINDESAEIAKLSLWLRTAQRGRTLSDLSNNIKCGNSLIDAPEIAGDKAFDWNAEFAEIMQNGGFDVVLGNPPYVRLQGLKANYEKESNFYQQNYKAATANYDIYALFIEKSLSLINPNGKISYILPHKFLISEFGAGVRGLLAEGQFVEEILHFGSAMVFAEASTYTCILTLSKGNEKMRFLQAKPDEITVPLNFQLIGYENLNGEKWNLNTGNVSAILDKLNRQPLRVSDVFAKIFQGIATSADDIYFIQGSAKGNTVTGYSKALDKEVVLELGALKPLLKGEDVSKYKYLENQKFVIFPYQLQDGKASPMTEEYIQNNFPLTHAYLKANEKFLRGRENRRFDNDKEWFLFSRGQGISGVEQPKIIMREISFGTSLTFDNRNFYHNTTSYSLIKKDTVQEDYKFWLAILNSKLMWYFLKNTGNELRGGYFRFQPRYVAPFPLPQLSDLSQQDIFIAKADEMLAFNKTLQATTGRFMKRVIANLPIKNTTTKLADFYLYDFKTFLAELKKQKIELDLKAQDTWESYFDDCAAEINAIRQQIADTDAQINRMVYALYGLTAEEIASIEQD
jgi:hypothetical protein